MLTDQKYSFFLLHIVAHSQATTVLGIKLTGQEVANTMFCVHTHTNTI